MNTFYVYAHYDVFRNCRYIGKGSNNRAWVVCQRSKLWKETFKKVRPEVKILVKGIKTEKEALQIEANLIKLYVRNGYQMINLVATKKRGDGFLDTDIANDYIKNVRRGKNHYRYGKKLSEEVKEKIRQTKLANPTRYWKGKKRDPEHMKKFWQAGQTPEAREKRRLKMLGKTVSEETRRKLSIANLGKTHTEESKQKISIANKGKEPWLKGKNHSEETREKMRISAKKRCEDPEYIAKLKKPRTKGWTTKRAKAVRNLENGKIYRSAGEAAKDLGYNNDKGIWKAISGNANHHKNIRWEYV